MKTKNMFMVTALVLSCLLLAIPTPVRATAPEEDLLIVADLALGEDGTSASGTFTISSLLFPMDGGLAYEEFHIDQDDMTTHGVKTLTGGNGTITIKFQASITPEGVFGRFVVISGTGAYKKLHGVGATSAWMDYTSTPPTIHAIYSGKAHMD